MGLYNIEISNATNLTKADLEHRTSMVSFYNCVIAYWTIGNSAVGGIFSTRAAATKPNLAYLGDDVFKNDSNRTNWSGVFKNSKISNIPTSFEQNNKKATTFEICFFHCPPLTTLPSGLFDNCSAVTNFSSCFNNCTSLTTIPSGLFDNCTAVTYISSCFFNCTSLTTIPSGLFDNCTAVTDFSYCFYDCDSLTTIPSGLFDNCTAVTTFQSCFRYCSPLVYCEIPQFKINANRTSYLSGATLLSYLKSNSTTPPTITTDTIPNNTNLKIYVPDASVDAYKTATNWSAYASKIYPLSEYED